MAKKAQPRSETAGRARSRPPVALLRLGFLVLILAAWQAVALAAPPGLFAGPLETAQAFAGLATEGRLTQALGQSLTVYLTGTLAAVVVGVTIGAAMGTVQSLGATLDVYVHALAATPRVAFIPLIILLLGLGLEAKILVVFLGAVMPVILNAFAGVRAADADLIEMARATGASRSRILVHVVLPGALPYLLAGVRIGATIGLINTVVAELYTAVSGLGGLLALYASRFQMAEYLAVVVVLALIGVAMTEGLRLAETRLLRWRGEPD
ncbi:ABC transporter permease [Amaricoccus sp. HAR-UPW-R2A-40]|nr:ABC transporter permease [Amaricoccus sp. HAR-UPW-R2A-40]